MFIATVVNQQCKKVVKIVARPAKSAFRQTYSPLRMSAISLSPVAISVKTVYMNLGVSWLTFFVPSSSLISQGMRDCLGKGSPMLIESRGSLPSIIHARSAMHIIIHRLQLISLMVLENRSARLVRNCDGGPVPRMTLSLSSEARSVRSGVLVETS